MSTANRYSDIRFLIVDDIAAMRRIIKNSLKEIGYMNFSEAEDGMVASKLLAQQTFDIVIADLDMPAMDGLTLVSVMKADPKMAKIPVLIISAEADRKKIVSVISAGAYGYIIKPFTILVF